MTTTMEDLAKSLSRPLGEISDDTDTDGDTPADEVEGAVTDAEEGVKEGEEAEDGSATHAAEYVPPDDEEPAPAGKPVQKVAAVSPELAALQAQVAQQGAIMQQMLTLLVQRSGGVEAPVPAHTEPEMPEWVPPDKMDDFYSDPNKYLTQVYQTALEKAADEAARRIREEQQRTSQEQSKTADASDRFYAANRKELETLHQQGLDDTFMREIRIAQNMHPELANNPQAVYTIALKSVRQLQKSFLASQGQGGGNGGRATFPPTPTARRRVDTKTADDTYSKMAAAIGCRVPQRKEE